MPNNGSVAQPSWSFVFARTVHSVNKLFVWISSILAAAIMIVILQDIVRRYLLNDPSPWVLDICSFMLVYIFFFALAPTLEMGGHVSVDLFDRVLPDRFQDKIFFVGTFLILFFGVVLFITLFNETLEAFADDNIFPASTIPMKMKYIWMVGPVGAAQFILTTCTLFLSKVYQREIN